MALQKAVREKMKVPLLLMGASGSGKTVGALLIAKGIVWEMFPDMSDEERWEKVAIIDTEHKRSTMYVGMTIKDQTIGNFMIYDLKEPFSPERYAMAFQECKAAGCEVIIVDSITHAWSGVGGVLEAVDKLGGKFSDWNKVKPQEKKLLELFLDDEVHVIGTVRSKQGYEVTKKETGQLNIEKVGLKMDQKDTLEFEFAITFQLYHNHTAEAMKDNSNSFDQRFTITEETGRQIYRWAEIGVDIKAAERKKKQDTIANIETLSATSEQHQALLADIQFKMNSIPLSDFTQNALDKCLKLLEELEVADTNEPTEI